LIRKGEEGHSLFIIAKGNVLFTLPTDDGNELPTRMLAEGELFGEFALVYETQRTASAVAETDCTVLELTRDRYNQVKDTKFMQPLENRVKVICQMLVSDGLKRVAFLQDVPEETLDLVAHLFRFEELPAGTTIFREGEAADKFYVVFQGELVVSKKDELGFDNELGRIKAGMNFGDKALLSQKLRTATITTMSSCQLFSLNKEQFRKFLDAVPELNDEMVEKLNSFNLVQGITQQIPIFRSLSQKGEQLLSLLSSYTQFKAKKTILKQGENIPRCLFVILKGEVDVFVDGKRVRTLQPGDYFGEVLLVSNTAEHSATVKTKTGCWCLVIEQKAFESVFLDEPQLFAEIQLRVLGKDTPLEAVLRHPKAVGVLETFLEKEWAHENVEFWEAVTRLENLGERKIKKAVLRALKVDIDAVVQKKKKMLEDSANEIFEKYVKPGAPNEINISGTVRKEIEDEIDSADYSYDMFAKAKLEIQKMVEADNFNRFRISPEFGELLSTIGQYA